MMSESLQLPPLILSGHAREAVECDGRTAYAAGYPLDANPCHSIVPQWAWWRRGWIDAYLDKLEAEGCDETEVSA